MPVTYVSMLVTHLTTSALQADKSYIVLAEYLVEMLYYTPNSPL